MDALLTETSPGRGRTPISPRARLTGEEGLYGLGGGPAIDPPDRRTPPNGSEQARHGRRALLAGVATFVLVASVVGGLYAERGRLESLSLFHRAAPARAPAPVAGNDVALPPPVRPTGATAKTTAPGAVGKGNVPHATVATTPKPPAAAPTAAGRVSPQQSELNEITALQTVPTVAVMAAPAPRPAPNHPATAPAENHDPAGSEPPAKSGNEQPIAVAAPVPTTARGPTPVVVVPHPVGPLTIAAKLEAAPLASPAQVDLLHLVTEMAVMIRDLRTQNGQLRTEVQDLTTRVDGELTQFDQRLSVAEAKGAMAAAMGAGTADKTSARAEAPGKPATPPAPPPLVRSVKDYRIQAASPRLAMLNFAGAPDGDASSIQVSVGDDVPGVGRIQSIYQHGSAWVIQTDHGLIQ